MPVDVHLEPYEVALAASVGLQRQLASLRRPDAYGFAGDNGWTLHIEGACGELAFAKAVGAYWAGTVGTFKNGGDVGRVQVRTRSRSDYELIVRPDDADDAFFVLVLGRAPNYRVVGYMRARDAKRPEWLADHGGRPPAYFVPQDALNDFKGAA